MRQAQQFKRPDEVPSDVRLPPAQPEARGARMRMVVRVPILAPSGYLERAEPPDIHARIVSAFFGMPQMGEAIDEALHVQRIDQPDRSNPEETHPAQPEQQSGKDRYHNHGSS